MHLTFDPLLLLALAIFLPWTAICVFVRAWFFKARLALLIAKLQRRDHCTILPYIGGVERATSFALVRQIRKAPADRPLVLVIDTTGGDVSAGLQILHALAEHRGEVIVRVADECWSAGTIAALGADEILMAPDANLGFCDAIFKGDPSLLHTGPTMTAAARGEPVELVRSRHALRDLVRSIEAARVARGDTPGDAHALAERMVMSDCDHWQPLFIEQAKNLGLPARVDKDPIWYEVIRIAGWARR